MFCFSKTCRICKSSTNSFTLTCNNQKEVRNLLFNLFPELMNSKLNHFLKSLCECCAQQLQLFEKFKNDCIESDECYMRYLNQLDVHAGTHAELVWKLGIKQEYCQNNDSQIQPAVDNCSTEEASSYYGSVAYSNSIIDVNKDEINCIKETDNLKTVSSNNGIKNLQLKNIDSTVNTRTENGNIKLEFCQEKDLSNIAEDDITEIDIVKHEDFIADKGGTCNSFDSSVNSNESQEIASIKSEYCSGNDNLTSFANHDINIVQHVVWITDKYESCNSIDLSTNNESQEIAGDKLSLNHQTTRSKGKSYQCDLCTKSFSQKFNLMLHIRTHTGEKLFECDICKKSFSRKDALMTHKRSHTGEKPFECDICKKSFSIKSNLMKHKRTHTGEKPHECDICKKNFSLKSHMMIHKRTHTGEKPHVCDVCKKNFTYLSSLIDHKRTHTGEKPYHCDLCKKSFASKSNLNAHKRSYCLLQSNQSLIGDRQCEGELCAA